MQAEEEEEEGNVAAAHSPQLTAHQKEVITQLACIIPPALC